MVLHLLKRSIIVGITCHLFVCCKGIKIGEDGIALQMTRVVDLQVLRVGVHRLDLSVDFIYRVAQVDAVTEALTHLCLAVGTGQTQTCSIVRQQNIRLHERLTINVVEAAHYLATLLEHGLLVIAGRHSGCLEHCDIGSLTDRISEKADRDTFAIEATHLYLRLDGRVALQA